MRRGSFRFLAVPVGGKGTVTLKTLRSRGRKAIRIARRSYTVPASTKVKVKVRISKRTLRRLRAVGRRTIRSRATIVLDGTTFTPAFKLKVPGR